jgi:transcription initiation factor TFIID subunit 6
MASPLFPTDTIKDVADSLGIQTLSADAAKQLAMDVEYRIQEVVQEALKVMRHSKRTVLTPADISSALRTLNIEPLYGYNSSRPIKFKEATTQDGLQLYYLDDEEVEFEKIINQPLPKIPREVEFAAHWLAIEGVQPAIVQNPTLADLKSADQSTAPTGTGTSSSLAAASGAEGVETKREIKHVLSKELQLYYEKVTKALVNEDTEAIRETAIASLRNDRGLHQLVPYLVAFVAEKVTLPRPFFDLSFVFCRR